MPYFDRFDICEAYYCFSYLFHTGMNSKEYERFSQLNRINFKPKPNLTTGKRLGLTENGYEIFKNLVTKLRGN